MNRKILGDRAETQACRFLQNQGLELIQRNFRCRGGEIDLIMQHDDSLVFVEVRYRKRSDYGAGAETVSRAKQQRVIRCARLFLQGRKCCNVPARFDVVSIAGEPGRMHIEWIPNAFWADA